MNWIKKSLTNKTGGRGGEHPHMPSATPFGAHCTRFQNNNYEVYMFFSEYSKGHGVSVRGRIGAVECRGVIEQHAGLAGPCFLLQPRPVRYVCLLSVLAPNIHRFSLVRFLLLEVPG